MTLCLMALLFVACKDQTNQDSTNTEPTEEKSERSEAPTFYGEDFEVANVIQYDSLLMMLKSVDSIANIVVEGKVDGVCQKKGCWMNIVSDSNEEAEELFVKFKDYGFFMPKDLTGNVVMKGNVYREETSVEELRHYAEDEGQSPEEIAKIIEPITEYKFMASGVKMAK